MLTTSGDAESAVDNAPTTAPCMEIIDALGTFCVVEKRSGTLDGTIPARAARGCLPFVEGNAAGFQLRLAQPAVLRVTDGVGSLDLTDEAYQSVESRLAGVVDHLLTDGFLEAGSPWEEQLRLGLAGQDGSVFSLWTGLLVRPTSGLWTLVGSAFNRRSRVNLHEYVIVDERRFVPVVLDIDLAALASDETWLDGEVGCLTSLRPDVRFTIHPIEEDPSVGTALDEFYTDRYLQKKEGRNVTGFYRRQSSSQPDEAQDGPASCRLVVAGSTRHNTTTFARWASADGITEENPTDLAYEIGMVHNQAEVRGRWDGQMFRDVAVDLGTQADEFLERWRALYGEKASAVEYFSRYANWAEAPFQGEPYLMLSPWVFAVTPPGWSSLTEGCAHHGFDPLRGVLSTDWFFSLGPLFQFWEPRSFVIPAGQPIERVLPVPRSVLKQPALLRAFDDSAEQRLLAAAGV